MVKIVSEAQMQEASQAASWGMLLGGVKYGAIGGTTMLLAHQFVPFVNRMTIPGKVFLVTGFTITGAMVYAEEALFEYHERNPPRRPQ